MSEFGPVACWAEIVPQGGDITVWRGEITEGGVTWMLKDATDTIGGKVVASGRVFTVEHAAAAAADAAGDRDLRVYLTMTQGFGIYEFSVRDIVEGSEATGRSIDIIVGFEGVTFEVKP